MKYEVPEIVGVYRITHIDNLRMILQDGIYATNTAPDNPDYKFIADRDLTDRRSKKSIPLEGHTVMGDYIPFYFGERSPMLYTIHKKMPTPQEEVIYLLVKLDSLLRENCDFCFTDGHASQQITTYYASIDDLDKLDWPTIKSKDWANSEDDRDRKRRKSAELLVKSRVPAACIDHIVTFDADKLNKSKQIVLNLGLDIPCSANKLNFYY